TLGVLVTLAVVAYQAVVRLERGPGAVTTTTQPAVSPQVPATPGPSRTASTPSTPSTDFVLPPGWKLRDDGTGFAVPVPASWRFSRDKDGRPRWSDPKTATFLLIDQTRQPKPDPVRDWLANEAARRDGYRAYERIRIEAVDYYDRAADWEFTYTSASGTPLHVLNRGFVTAPDQAYSIYWSTRADRWAAELQRLRVVFDGFRPART
ncbi:MAG: serine/threonine protein kinase, partial [Hamadaea sp.]|nr:serine/threonine protein kinase [Hamadaea sp.]